MSEQDHAAVLEELLRSWVHLWPKYRIDACEASIAALRDLECLRETGYTSVRELYHEWNSADDECDKARQRIAELDQFIAAHPKKVGSYAGWMIVEESADGSLLLNNLNDGTRRRIWNTSQERITELEAQLTERHNYVCELECDLEQTRDRVTELEAGISIAEKLTENI